MQQKPIIGMHRADETNVGDYWSSPWKHFDLEAQRVIDVDDASPVSTEETPEAEAIIVGGGGLLKHKPKWDRTMDALTDESRPVIAWGIGLGAVLRPFTASQHVDFLKRRVRSILKGDLSGSVGGPDASLPEYLQRFDLVGVRDDLPGMEVPWVPCASCMHPAFDEPVEVTREVAVLEHKGVPIQLDQHLPDDVRMQNTGTALEPLLRFIASCQTLVTSTYHGAYWGTLLGRRVIVYRPFSIKFKYMRHPPTIYSGNLATDIQRSRVYPEALEECRAANRHFYEDVCEILKAPRLEPALHG